MMSVKEQLAAAVQRAERAEAERDELRRWADLSKSHNPYGSAFATLKLEWQKEVDGLESALAASREEVRVLLEGLLAAHKEADDDRLSETREAHDEAEKWMREGDMYGWNFHQGRASGVTQASIIFFRVRRAIESALAAGQGESATQPAAAGGGE